MKISLKIAPSFPTSNAISILLFGDPSYKLYFKFYTNIAKDFPICSLNLALFSSYI